MCSGADEDVSEVDRTESGKIADQKADAQAYQAGASAFQFAIH